MLSLLSLHLAFNPKIPLVPGPPFTVRPRSPASPLPSQRHTGLVQLLIPSVSSLSLCSLPDDLEVVASGKTLTLRIHTQRKTSSMPICRLQKRHGENMLHESSSVLTLGTTSRSPEHGFQFFPLEDHLKAYATCGVAQQAMSHRGQPSISDCFSETGDAELGLCLCGNIEGSGFVQVHYFAVAPPSKVP